MNYTEMQNHLTNLFDEVYDYRNNKIAQMELYRESIIAAFDAKEITKRERDNLLLSVLGISDYCQLAMGRNDDTI